MRQVVLNAKCYYLIVLFILINLSNTASGQVTAYTEADVKLDTAVHMYNRLRDYTGSLSTADLNQGITIRLKQTNNEVINILNEVIAIGSPENISAAKYFKTLSTYDLGYMQALNGENVTALATLETIKTDLLNYRPSDFKKYYKYENTNYSISWENIAPTILECYSAMSELYAINNNNAAALNLSREGLAFEFVASDENNKNWHKYLLANNYINVANLLRNNAAESADIAIKQITYYAFLTPSYLATINESSTIGYSTGYDFIVNLKSNNAALVQDGGLYARTAIALKSNNDILRGPEMFKLALEKGYYEYSFINDAYAMADLARNNQLGLLAAEKQELRISSTDCAAWMEIATKWSKYGNIEKSNAALAKSRSCEIAAAAIQKELAKQQERENRRAERDFSIYAGIYPLPLIIRYNKYRDYGGIVGFGMHNFSMEVSYKIINLNHVIYDDLAIKDIDYNSYENYWDGYRAHVAFKFGDRDTYGEGTFVGPLFEVVSRNYESVKSDVYTADASTYLYQATFTPTELSYNAYINFGGRVEENHFMIEYFMGLGVAYHQFDGGGLEYDNELLYLINPILETRTPTRFGAAVRMGITIGLSTRN